METPHKHHIVPTYKCIELGLTTSYKIGGKEFYFKENMVEVPREQHALIHWGYKCKDLKPLLEVCNPPQWVIDMIPLGDIRDEGAASGLARGEIEGIEPLSGNDHPQYIPVLDLNGNGVEGSENWPEKRRYYFRKLVSEGVQPITHEQRAVIREENKRDKEEKRRKKKEKQIIWKNSLEYKEQRKRQQYQYNKKIRQSPKGKEEYNAYMREYMKKRRIVNRKKLEKQQGQGTLEQYCG